MQLVYLIVKIIEVNKELKTMPATSNNYLSLQDLNTNYIVQLIKAIFVLIAEVCGLVLCNMFEKI